LPSSGRLGSCSRATSPAAKSSVGRLLQVESRGSGPAARTRHAWL